MATSERLLAAAEEEFGRVGFAAARLEDIAARAGISRPSLLYHYESKQALYEAVVAGAFARLGVALARAMARGGAFPERLDAVVDGYLAFLRERPAISALLLRELLDAQGPGHALLLRAGDALLKRLEAWARRQGPAVRPSVPVRAAVLQVAFGALCREAAGPLRDPLWGRADHTRALARALFLQE